MAQPTKPKRSYNLDIKTVMHAADLKKRKFYDNLTELERKSFVPLTAQRWLSDVRGDVANYILSTHFCVNRYVFNLPSGHTELLWLLMSVAGNGKPQTHGYIAQKPRKTLKKIDELLADVHPNCNDDEWEIVKSMYNNDELIELAKNLGKDDNFIKDLKSEVKKSGTE